MSKDVVSIQSEAPLLSALDLMEEHAITALPVVDGDNRCIGLISSTDVAFAARATASQLTELIPATEEERAEMVVGLVANGIGHKSVHDAMRYKLKCVREDTLIAKAGSKMLWTRFHHLPVVDREQKLVGIISTLDLLAAFVKGTSMENDEKSVHAFHTDDTNADDTVAS